MKVPRYFLNHWRRAFETSRVDNHRMVTEFVSRLERILADNARPAPAPLIGYKMGKGWRSSPDGRRSVSQILTLLWHERGYLRNRWPRQRGTATWLAADDRRSGIIEGWAELSNQLRIFGGQSAPTWLRDWQAEGRRLICFTPNLFALRPRASQDTIHLSYLSLFAVPLVWPVAFVAATLRMLANQPPKSLTYTHAWITSLLAASLDVLLTRQVPTRLLMITSNSFVIELLRYMYWASGQGEGVTEVLHGIPSLDVERYHKDVMAFPYCRFPSRVRLVAPVPGLPLDTVGSHIEIDTNAINLKMNAVSRQRDLSALAEECVRRNVARGGVPVITLNGAGTVEGKHYLQTSCFAAEKTILRRVLGEARQQGLIVHVQYSLHPAHIKSGDASAIRQALAIEGVETLEDSMQSWLESDLCISLFSSASWDAVALGCDVVFGVSPDDQLYSGAMLSSFAYPTQDLMLFDVLSLALARIPDRPRPSPHDRVATITGKPTMAA